MDSLFQRPTSRLVPLGSMAALGQGLGLAMLAALMLSASAGCHLWPNVSHPGTADAQRRRATMHDPYPDPVLAPDVVGGRPREFQVPYPEAVKNRAFVDQYRPPTN